jgi:hypothetical protein
MARARPRLTLLAAGAFLIVSVASVSVALLVTTVPLSAEIQSSARTASAPAIACARAVSAASRLQLRRGRLLVRWPTARRHRRHLLPRPLGRWPTALRHHLRLFLRRPLHPLPT